MSLRQSMTAFVFAIILVPGGAGAQVVVNRQGDENPAISVTKSILWGGLGGLILGGAIALVADDNEGEIVKWSFVGGTFGGLALGLWHVTHRPEPPQALLEADQDGVRFAAPVFDFESRPDPLLGGEGIDHRVRLALLSIR
ncbi:MAG: hypothetical protein ABIK65_07925 [Candidatus Eisenbacteria bacterium]